MRNRRQQLYSAFQGSRNHRIPYIHVFKYANVSTP
jgi:hypothetical protein